MKERLSRFTRFMLKPRKNDKHRVEGNSIIPMKEFNFDIIDNGLVGDNVFKFSNIDDFDIMIKEFNRGLDSDLVINVLEKKLLDRGLKTDKEFNLIVITG